MIVKPSQVSIIIILILTITSLLHILVSSLGSSASTIAVTFNSTAAAAAVCGVIAGEPTQRIQCYQNGQAIFVLPNVSFEAISGGFGFFCGLRSGGLIVLCWDTASFQAKRIYYNDTIRLTDLSVGDDQVCAREVNSGAAKCWRGYRGRSPFPSPGIALSFSTITSGSGFTCGILRNSSSVHCWGENNVGAQIQKQFGNLTMSTLVAGESHACGLSKSGLLVCGGSDELGQLDVPFGSAFEYSGLAVGTYSSCAIRQRNGVVTCWGGGNEYQHDRSLTESVSFELIAAGLDFFCGLTTGNLSMICWGPGWSHALNRGHDVPLGVVIPGPCVQSSCSACGVYPGSETLCDGSGNICKSCQIEIPLAVLPPPIISQPLSQGLKPVPPTKATKNLSVAFATVGSVGVFAGICTIFYFLYVFLCKRYHNSVQFPTDAANVSTATAAANGSVTPQGLGRQRSSSSSKHVDKIEKFSLSEILLATNNFSLENKIGAGSFGSVYQGKLADGRAVAIKREETDTKREKLMETEIAFDSEVALLSRLHHKHLVGLTGFCEEKDERLLVYEYMSNGSLHDHLHNRSNTERSSSALNCWKMRIKIALDAARGIEYLHNYAVPPIIHRDIKTSNILLDSDWTAKVSDFGLSLMGPQFDEEFSAAKAVGTVGYIDPEYYVLNIPTPKSDIYGLGVVLLELLTGKRAVFKNEEDHTSPIGVIDYATPLISAGELQRLVDERVGPLQMHEVEAVELMAYTAFHCVNLEGKERPCIIDVVANLERALALCENHLRFSTATLSTNSD